MKNIFTTMTVYTSNLSIDLKAPTDPREFTKNSMEMEDLANRLEAFYLDDHREKLKACCEEEIRQTVSFLHEIAIEIQGFATNDPFQTRLDYADWWYMEMDTPVNVANDYLTGAASD